MGWEEVSKDDPRVQAIYRMDVNIPRSKISFFGGTTGNRYCQSFMVLRGTGKILLKEISDTHLQESSRYYLRGGGHLDA